MKTYPMQGLPGLLSLSITDGTGADVTERFLKHPQAPDLIARAARRAALEVDERQAGEYEAAPDVVHATAAAAAPEPWAPRLGERVRDTLTGFEGYVSARAEYFGARFRCQVSADFGERTAGRLAEEWFDEARLAKVG